MGKSDIIIGVTLTIVLTWLSWLISLKGKRYHGIFRLISFESILLLVLLNHPVWFKHPLAWYQLLSWTLLGGSLGLAILGFYLYYRHGKPVDGMEETTTLITSGLYRYIRHPLYLSLMPGGFGVMLKDLRWHSIIPALANLLALYLFLSGCEQLDQKTDAIRGFFQNPPVWPMLEVIQTSVPAGFCAAAAMSDQLGHAIPGADVSHVNGLSLIHLHNGGAYPLSLLAVPCDEIYILRLGMDEEMCMISAFFVSALIQGRQQVYHVGPMPVMLDDQHVRAILAWNHVAVEQDAWIIEIATGNTWSDYGDDTFMITGGEQDISTMSGAEGTAAGVLQMGMIDMMIEPECLKNPVSGFTVLREIEVETGNGKPLDDLLLGTILYAFDKSCKGSVRVALATGSFLLATCQDIEFNMMDKLYGFQ